jgi:hypothetical protein
MPTDARLYKIRDKRRFLIAAMQELAGTARPSFEGDLSSTAVGHLAGASVDETEILKRNTRWPKQDFVVLPLETDIVEAIIAAVGGTVPRGILHIQIEKGNRLELGLYDNCAPKASFFGTSLTSIFFANLQGEGISSQWTDADSRKSASVD